MLLFRISGLLLNWMILCPTDKKDLLMEYIDKIKSAAGKDPLAPLLCEPKHHLKFHRGDVEDVAWKHKLPEDPVTELKLREMPW